MAYALRSVATSSRRMPISRSLAASWSSSGSWPAASSSPATAPATWVRADPASSMSPETASCAPSAAATSASAWASRPSSILSSSSSDRLRLDLRRSRRVRAAAGRARGPVPGRGCGARRVAPRPPADVRTPGRTPPSPRGAASPANVSRACRCAEGRSSRCWSDWPWTATSSSVTSASSAAGTVAPPANARDRPCDDSERPSTTTPSSRRPPASVIASATPEPSGTAMLASTRAWSSPVRTRPEVGAVAAQQAEGGDDHRLAGAGLTGDDGESRAELELGGVDDAQRARA